MKFTLSLLVCYTTLLLSSCQRRDKVAVVIIGDSFVYGIGSEGTSSSADFFKGRQRQGDYTWQKQLEHLLDERNDFNFEYYMFGFPGQTSAWYKNSDELNVVVKRLQEGGVGYKKIIYCSAFGTNDQAAENVNDSTSVDTLVMNINSISKRIRNVKSIKGRLTILGYPLTRVEGKFAKPNGNAFRKRYNSLIINNPSIIGADKVLSFKSYPDLYSDEAPKGYAFNQDDVDGLNGVHPNNKGYEQLAKMTADCINQTLKK